MTLKEIWLFLKLQILIFSMRYKNALRDPAALAYFYSLHLYDTYLPQKGRSQPSYLLSESPTTRP